MEPGSGMKTRMDTKNFNGKHDTTKSRVWTTLKVSFWILGQAALLATLIATLAGILQLRMEFVALGFLALFAAVWFFFSYQSHKRRTEESVERLSDLFRITLGSVNAWLESETPRAKLRFEFLNLSILDAHVRKFVYSIKVSRGTGSREVPVVSNRSFDREVDIPHQGGNTVTDEFNLDAGVVKALLAEAAQARQDETGVFFQGSAEIYVTFKTAGDKKLHAALHHELPYYRLINK
jgi:hypothetical protein